ncbi:MAG: PPC domain-containing protein, partial [Acidobacteriota bacterium]
LASYGCVRSLELGPEVFYAFATPVAKTVTVTLTGFTGDLDLIVIGDAGTPPADACDPYGKCLTASTTTGTESVTFSAAAGATYYLAVEGATAADASSYTITVASCL